MSNLDRTPSLTQCGGLIDVATQPVRELFQGREVQLGESTKVRRLLPNLGRRLVGAWCFVDHYGPDDIASAPGMQIPPHPHMGLQTVSWLLEGEIHHRDSIGSDDVIRPGVLGVMTSGAAIAHAEQSPPTHPARLHGVQLWVALPDEFRTVAPGWDRHDDLPAITEGALNATVFMGEVAGLHSPGRTFSPLVGVDMTIRQDGAVTFPLERAFEHAVLVLSGTADVDDVPLSPGAMLYLGMGRADLALKSGSGARLMLLGGVPFDEQIVMWWNFVARTSDEIAAARAEWMDGTAFGTVVGFAAADALAAPPLPPGRLRPGGRTR
ncbi:MAG TPA: pirin family protein [Jatrophihabitantaceae bacterium]|nr:pirin family protein [Jatrophihabitantaceae bacterium]